MCVTVVEGKPFSPHTQRRVDGTARTAGGTGLNPGGTRHDERASPPLSSHVWVEHAVTVREDRDTVVYSLGEVWVLAVPVRLALTCGC